MRIGISFPSAPHKASVWGRIRAGRQWLGATIGHAHGVEGARASGVMANKGYLARNPRDRMWPLIEAGRIKPQIYKTFALERAADAHRLMESSQHIGKIVLAL